MKSFSLSSKLKPALSALALAVLLQGCVSSTSTTTQNYTLSTSDAFAPLTLTLTQYQDLVAQVSDEDAFNAEILLTRAQIVSGDLTSAKATIQSLRQSAITPLQQDEISIVEALLFTKDRDYLSAAANLNAINEMTLPKQVASYYYQLNTRVNESLFKESQNEQYLQRAFSSQKSLLNVIDAKERTIVLRQTVELLKDYQTSRLVALASSSADELDKGYYAYAIMDSATSPEIKNKLLGQFKEQYPNHPLNELAAFQQEDTTTNQGIAQSVVSNVPYLKDGDRLAVLLPLSGRFQQAVGNPARLGILSALQDIEPKIKVVFYDTAKIEMSQIVADLKNTKTNFIIGPILKPEVDALINAQPNIPTIMLNSTNQALPSNMWYFDLSPEYEGRLAASKMIQDGIKNPLLISASNSKAQRASAAFNQNMQKALGKSPTVCQFTNLDDLKSRLQTCPLQGHDGVYISASALEASNVKATLPSLLPTYITNQSNTGVNSSSLEVSMYGANLGDMPWLITESELKSAMLENIPKADVQVQRIFASSYDALGLALNLNKLLDPASHDVLHGLSGDVDISSNGLIEAAPLWVKLGTTIRE